MGKTLPWPIETVKHTVKAPLTFSPIGSLITDEAVRHEVGRRSTTSGGQFIKSPDSIPSVCLLSSLLLLRNQSSEPPVMLGCVGLCLTVCTDTGRGGEVCSEVKDIAWCVHIIVFLYSSSEAGLHALIINSYLRKVQQGRQDWNKCQICVLIDVRLILFEAETVR